MMCAAQMAADKYFCQREKLWQHRMKLREQNLAKSKSAQKGQETKMKKIQGFLRKTKQFDKNVKNVAALIKEMKKLKLGPYIDEVIKDLTTANISDKEDIRRLCHLASALHQRFEQKFTKAFKDGILDAFRPKLDVGGDASVRRRQKQHLMILVEMQFVGLLKGGSRLYELLKHVIRTESKHKAKLSAKLKKAREAQSEVGHVEQGEEDKDKDVQDNNYKMEDSKNRSEISEMIWEYDEVMIHTMTLMTTFLRYANEECLGQLSESVKPHFEAKEREFAPTFHDILDAEQRAHLSQVLLAYFAKICDKYLALDLKLRRQQKTNKLILIERGSISDSRQEITCKLETVVHGLRKHLRLFCEHLPQTCSFPQELEMANEEVTLNIDGRSLSLLDAQKASFFDDEVSRSFYIITAFHI